MAFASGPISFRRFFITGPFPRTVDEALCDALRKNAFGKQKSASPDGGEIGWIAPEHLFDTNLSLDKIGFDRFVHVMMRVDRVAAPSSIVRSYTRMEEQAALDASGKQFLSKAERKQARENAVARAEREAKAGLFRRIGAVPVLIDVPARTVYLANLGGNVADKFIALFRETFDVALEPGTSDNVAHRIMEAAGDPRAAEDAEPFHLVPSREVAEDNGFDFNDRTFFGREFLTWLWYRTDRRQGAFEHLGQAVSVMMTKIMHLDCDFKVTGSDTVRCDGPASAPEARAALPLGKQPTRLGLVLATRAGECSMLFDGPKFTVSGLRLPDSEQADPRARLEERFSQITETVGTLDMLFGLFLGRRAAADWPTELAKLKSWALGRTNEPNLTLRFPSQAEAAAT